MPDPRNIPILTLTCDVAAMLPLTRDGDVGHVLSVLVATSSPSSGREEAGSSSSVAGGSHSGSGDGHDKEQNGGGGGRSKRNDEEQIGGGGRRSKRNLSGGDGDSLLSRRINKSGVTKSYRAVPLDLKKYGAIVAGIVTFNPMTH